MLHGLRKSDQVSVVVTFDNVKTQRPVRWRIQFRISCFQTNSVVSAKTLDLNIIFNLHPYTFI